MHKVLFHMAILAFHRRGFKVVLFIVFPVAAYAVPVESPFEVQGFGRQPQFVLSGWIIVAFLAFLYRVIVLPNVFTALVDMMTLAAFNRIIIQVDSVAELHNRSGVHLDYGGVELEHVLIRLSRYGRCSCQDK